MNLNIFQKNSQDLYCQLYLYELERSLLYVKVLHGGHEFYICFQDTLFFSGFRSWRGSHFQIQPDIDCIRLLELGGYGTGLVTVGQMVSLGQYKLLHVEGTSPLVQILCQFVNIYSEDEMQEYLELK